MSLVTACCCPTLLGRCCVLDTTSPFVDCVDICTDEVIQADCTALGGIWQLGLCADVNACKGVCCATDSTGYFVACQEGVTQCECFSDNLAPGVTTNWTSGNDLTCADIACPCQCAELCPCVKYIIITYTHDIYIYGSQGCVIHYHYYESDPIGVGVGGFALDGTDTPCPDAQAIFDYYLSYAPTTGYSNTYYYDDGITISQTDTMVVTATINPHLLCPSSICNPAPINMGNHDYINYSTRNYSYCSYEYVNTNISTPEYLTPGSCVTCGYEDCVHEFDDCEDC